MFNNLWTHFLKYIVDLVTLYDSVACSHWFLRFGMVKTYILYPSRNVITSDAYSWLQIALLSRYPNNLTPSDFKYCNGTVTSTTQYFQFKTEPYYIRNIRKNNRFQFKRCKRCIVFLRRSNVIPYIQISSGL